MPLSLTILTGAFGPQRRGAIIGIWGGLGGLAVAGGPLIGGAVTEGPDWHWIWLNVPVGVAAVALSRARLPESHGRRQGWTSRRSRCSPAGRRRWCGAWCWRARPAGPRR